MSETGLPPESVYINLLGKQPESKGTYYAHDAKLLTQYLNENDVQFFRKDVVEKMVSEAVRNYFRQKAMGEP